jgi:hypothetical protein
MELITTSRSESEAGRAERRAATARVAAFFNHEYRRTRPRDPDKAALLRRAGCPERLIGPVKTDR